MPVPVIAALVSGLVALAVGLASGAIALLQFRREKSKWIVDTKMAWNLELYKRRLDSYPAVFDAMRALSHGSAEPATAETADEVAHCLNDWLYSAGGMSASSTSRGAVLGLRIMCRNWHRTGERPKELYEFRNMSLRSLRLDLDLVGLEEYEFDDMKSWLRRLQDEMNSAVDRRPGRTPPPLGTTLPKRRPRTVRT
ncbi:hypothetical protein AB0F72_31265 [Actinoplanes sp. NPDC023936]|uniref:hypothetical protein n=1 Tax=Actinoplanes sp. NPDC023936 TaxID=3154910 RepID=UPI0033FCB3D1